MSTQSSQSRPSATAAILIASVLWGTTGTASSLAPAGAPALIVGAAGLTLGGALLLLTSRAGLRLLLTRQPLVLLGAAAVATYPLSFYPAVASTGVAVATVLTLGSGPVFTGLLARVLHGHRLTGHWALATTAAVLGCAVLVIGAEGSTHLNPTGILLALLAGLAYAAYTVIGAHLIDQGADARGAVGSMFGGAALLTLPVVLLSQPVWLTTPRGAAVAAHLALITTFLAYLLFGHGLRHTTAAVAATLTLLEPAVATVLGILVTGEHLPALSWTGLAVLGAGILVLAFD
ncbi:DMT family transporter [Kutzneria albida]|uniref:EamA domain-containing protein n=1 Tax=Kutzneria albida DSM 43870 TaxID=1449976 RepID=W5W9W8_9PSEU|nr:EamA family transporter [Kutzneria albida]AHH97707.1 hypothetical protein KALB_4345 [Kutzneria albida DSM 43870]